MQKILLCAYSRGIVSSRKIEPACRENVIIMALSADTQPHFTTIADFIACMDKEVIHLFRDVLLVCDDLGLIGKEMFAINEQIFNYRHFSLVMFIKFFFQFKYV